MEKEYISPQIIENTLFDVMSPLCVSTGGLPAFGESDELGNVGGWN
jgi:hypothetical protein